MDDDLWLDSELIQAIVLDNHKDEKTGKVDKLAILRTYNAKFVVYDEERDIVDRWKEAVGQYG